MVGAAAALAYVRSDLRRRWASYGALALVVALGAGVAMGSLVLAHRTDRTYPEYVERSDVNALVVNPSLVTTAMDAEMRALRGIRSVRTDDLIAATVTHTTSGTIGEILADEDMFLQVRGSTDGRYVDVDRPAVSAGRLPAGDREVFVSDDYRRDLEDALGRPLAVGDTIDVAFWSAAVANADPAAADVHEPLGVEHLRVAGFGLLPDEVLPEELYPRQRVLLSADVARRYTCTKEFRGTMSEEEAFAALLPDDCATLYRYYSLGLEPGTSVDEVAAQFGPAADRASTDLPPIALEFGPFHFISQDRAELDDAVVQATRPVIVTLLTFAALAGFACVVIFGLVSARLIRQGDGAQQSLLALGAPRGVRSLAVAGGSVLSLGLGLVAAIGVAAAVSTVGPLGSVGALAVDRHGVSLPGVAVLPSVFGLGVVMALVLAGVALAAARRVARRPGSARHRSARRPFPAPISSPALVVGLRAAGGRAGAGAAALAGVTVAVVVAVAATLFGSNLTMLVSSSPNFGWPWQVGVITDSGYGSAAPAAVDAALGGRDDVTGWSYYSFESGTVVDGQPVASVIGLPGGDGRDFPVVSGRPAERPGELVLGSKTAHDLGLEVGDRVTISSAYAGDVVVELVGTAVLPSLGPFLADRTGLGAGAYLVVDELVGDETSALVAIRLREGSDVDAFIASIQPEIATFDEGGFPPLVIDHAVRPPEIVNIDEMRGAPVALALVLAIALAIGLAMSISVSVRERRRELAILRTLGCGGRDLRSSVRWQALATIGAGLVVGLPLGIVVGRLAWRAFADRLGLVPRAELPLGWLALVAFVAVVLALASAHGPGRAAARLSPAEVLRAR